MLKSRSNRDLGYIHGTSEAEEQTMNRAPHFLIWCNMGLTVDTTCPVMFLADSKGLFLNFVHHREKRINRKHQFTS
jgi:hypothetical protein